MFYVFHGPDDFTRTEKITALKAALGDASLLELNLTLLDGQNVRLSDIQNQAGAMPFLAPKRLVIATGYLTVLGKKKGDLQPLLDYLPHLPPTTDLVFVEKESLDKGHPLLKAPGIEVIHFDEPEAKHLQPWLIKRAKTHGATLEREAAELLGRLVGTNLRALDNELEKLALYAGPRPIQKADVELLTPDTEEAARFGIANAIGRRDARQAYDQLQRELDEGKNPLALLGGIVAQIRGLLEVKDMVERGLSPAEIAKAKGWRGEYAAHQRLAEANNFSITRLEQILELLLETDLAIKSGRIENHLALDLLIARLCGR